MNNKYRKKTFYKTLSFSLGISMLLSGAFSGSASAGSLPGSSEKAQNSGNPESPKASLENAGQAPSAPPLSEAEAIHIADVEDLLSFAKCCTLDAWSQNKVFVLDNDLDLSGTDFSPIPTFGGCFLGQGHTISGISLEGGSSNIGLFRYVQESGQIYQLNVSGIVQAPGSHSGLAMLVGSNAGYLSDCHCTGNITGGDRVGGIAGTNELTGIISGCSTNGLVNGRHLAGGIAGCNEGCITGSVNRSLVNFTAEHNSIDLSEINTDTTITDLLTTENAASVTDIGGIAGSNPGIIKACTNEGTVGYQHVGYNIGGIAGSQTGYIEGCVNSGHLYGRKDIGGIAGQMEPSSKLEYLEDTLQKLDTEFEKLHGLLTVLNSHASGTSERLTGQIGQLLNSVEGASRPLTGFSPMPEAIWSIFPSLRIWQNFPPQGHCRWTFWMNCQGPLLRLCPPLRRGLPVHRRPPALQCPLKHQRPPGRRRQTGRQCQPKRQHQASPRRKAALLPRNVLRRISAPWSRSSSEAMTETALTIRPITRTAASRSPPLKRRQMRRHRQKHRRKRRYRQNHRRRRPPPPTIPSPRAGRHSGRTSGLFPPQGLPWTMLWTALTGIK